MVKSKSNCPKWHFGQVGHGGKTTTWGVFLQKNLVKKARISCNAWWYQFSYGYVWFEGSIHVQMANIKAQQQKAKFIKHGLKIRVKHVAKLVEIKATNLVQTEVAEEEIRA